MAIPLLIHWIIIKCILVVDSAPMIDLESFRNGLDDPLIESSDSYLSYELSDRNLRRGKSAEQVQTQYEGYLFNENICKRMNNRILCGYDTNKGEYFDRFEFTDMGNGCRTRGDRIECGYNNEKYSLHLRQPVEKSELKEKNGGDNFDILARHASTSINRPTRTSRSTTPQTHEKIQIVNRILNSTFSKLLTKSSNNLTETTLISKLIKAVTLPSTFSTTITPTSDVPTLSTTIISNSTSVRESTPIFKPTRTKPSTPLLTNKITSILTSTSETSVLKDTLSDIEVIKLPKIPNDQERSPSKNNRSLSEVLSITSISKLNAKSDTNIVSTADPPIVDNHCITTSKTYLRSKSNSGDKITTACVEKEDRIVCYDFKTQ